jgi:hypothetical protein
LNLGISLGLGHSTLDISRHSSARNENPIAHDRSPLRSRPFWDPSRLVIQPIKMSKNPAPVALPSVRNTRPFQLLQLAPRPDFVPAITTCPAQPRGAGSTSFRFRPSSTCPAQSYAAGSTLNQEPFTNFSFPWAKPCHTPTLVSPSLGMVCIICKETGASAHCPPERRLPSRLDAWQTQR